MREARLWGDRERESMTCHLVLEKARRGKAEPRQLYSGSLSFLRVRLKCYFGFSSFYVFIVDIQRERKSPVSQL